MYLIVFVCYCYSYLFRIKRDRPAAMEAAAKTTHIVDTSKEESPFPDNRCNAPPPRATMATPKGEPSSNPRGRGRPFFGSSLLLRDIHNNVVVLVLVVVAPYRCW